MLKGLRTSSRDVFVVPDDVDILDAFGVEPVGLDDEPTIRTIILPAVGPDDSLRFSYDVVGQSINCRWSRSGDIVVSIFREFATLLTIHSGRGRGGLAVDFDGEVLVGRLLIEVYPMISIADRLFFR